jgi:hypothetical protein
LDFRDEIMAQIYDRGDPLPFHIEVTDDGSTRVRTFFSAAASQIGAASED